MRYDEIYSDLILQINSGKWKNGDKLPTEREFSEYYSVSRPTISRVMNQLRDAGLLRRVIGAGTYLTEKNDLTELYKTFGLFIPGLGMGEIFEPICTRIAELSHEYNFNLIWGSIPIVHSPQIEEKLIQTAQRFINNNVDGVFFQPIEREFIQEPINQEITNMFTNSNIPIVLIDSDFVNYPERSSHDLICIDNVQAGMILCQHFLSQKNERVDFLWQPNTAGTYRLRLIGYREALNRAGIHPDETYEHEGNPRDRDFVKKLVDSGARNIICSNDETAVLLMLEIENMGLAIPTDIRIAGFDNLKYAKMAHVPLTTISQPCSTIGEMAVSTMLNRIQNPSHPPYTIMTSASLVVRESTIREF